MTDDLQPTPEEIELQKAKEAAAVPAEHIPDAEGLPADTRDGEVPFTEASGVPDDAWPSPGYLTPEPDPTGPDTHEGANE